MYAIYGYIDPPNHPNVGIYGSPMESLGYISRECQRFGTSVVLLNRNSFRRSCDLCGFGGLVAGGVRSQVFTPCPDATLGPHMEGSDLDMEGSGVSIP